LPSIQFAFFCIPAANDGKRDVAKFCRDQMNFASTVWNPKGPPEKGGPVGFTWDNNLRPVTDKDNHFKLIEFTPDGSPKALQLVKENWTVQAGPIIPVFVCYAAWDKLRDGGDKPREGLMKGFTLTKRGNPWFTGDRAILVFITTAQVHTLAHELAHWFGFTHADAKDAPGNVGQEGGGGTHLLDEQYHAMMRWANQADFRNRLNRVKVE